MEEDQKVVIHAAVSSAGNAAADDAFMLCCIAF